MDRPIKAYAAVTAAYWAFMLTDGALRMLVLLHFNALGFSALQLAWLFLLYELAGVVTNLSAGWLALRFGLAATLYAGLALQIAAVAALTQLDPSWGMGGSVAFVMAVQGVSGVAKDLAKMSSKSAVKLLAGEGRLFSLVAWLTGSKNAVKGFGFFLGAALLALIGFEAALWSMAGGLALILVLVLAFLPEGLSGGIKGPKIKSLSARDARVNRLSLARMFLFGARDVWFVVGLPVYFQSVFSDGTAEGRRAAFFLIGGFMAAWIIGYGAVQAAAPAMLRAATRSLTEMSAQAATLAIALVPIPLGLALAAAIMPAGGALTGVLILGLILFGVVFALNSALHSYLILAYSGAERVSLDVGFYYMANAFGRLIGTFLSGLSYQLGGLVACLATAGLMAALSFLAAKRLKTA